MASSNAIRIILAEDDPDDALLARDALKASRVNNEIEVVVDGEQLLERLRNQGRFSDSSRYGRPGLILLDLNMPRKDGREALAEIKADPDLRSIPVVVLTTSQAEEDILRTYDLGVNSFISKPVTFEGLVAVMSTLGTYWFELVELPPEDVKANHEAATD